ncbi:MAG: hypothetical protein HY613_05345 [Candidatus Rokubacteria bacterium]|nr:hypothetical protein [Candidatus Rokubacteria bacterium]
MATFDFYTVGDVLIFAQARPPSYPVRLAPAANAAVGETIGGRIRTEVRGPDRKHLSLRWTWITAAHLASFLSWHATYGGMKAPFKIELPADLTELAGGSKLRVRSTSRDLQYAHIAFAHYDLQVELVEDLGTEVNIMGSLGLGTVDVTADATSVDIAVAASATTYQVFINPNWNTGWWVTGKTLTQFTVNFVVPAPSGAKADWRADI